MSRWGFRWLFCWIGVIVTACTQLGSPSPATKMPLATVPSLATPTVDNLSRGPTPSPTSEDRLVTAEPTDPLSVSIPICYEQPTGTLICLGWLSSNSDQIVQNTQISVQLLSQYGRVLQDVLVVPDINSILPNQQIPYRAIFDPPSELTWYLQATIVAQTTTTLRHAPIVELLPDAMQIVWQGRDYRIEGHFMNASDEVVSLVQIIATIENDAQLSGFRVYVFEVELLPRDVFAFDINVAPLDGQMGQVKVAGIGVIR